MRMTDRMLHRCDHAWRVVRIIKTIPTRRTIVRCEVCKVGGEVVDKNTLSIIQRESPVTASNSNGAQLVRSDLH